MRIYTGDSDPLDFCSRHAPSEATARKRYGVAVTGPGPDGRGDCFSYDEDHPEYDEIYRCETCKCQLTERD